MLFDDLVSQQTPLDSKVSPERCFRSGINLKFYPRCLMKGLGILFTEPAPQIFTQYVEELQTEKRKYDEYDNCDESEQQYVFGNNTPFFFSIHINLSFLYDFVCFSHPYSFGFYIKLIMTKLVKVRINKNARAYADRFTQIYYTQYCVYRIFFRSCLIFSSPLRFWRE